MRENRTYGLMRGSCVNAMYIVVYAALYSILNYDILYVMLTTTLLMSYQ